MMNRAIAAACLTVFTVACSDPTVVYDAPDAAPWQSRAPVSWPAGLAALVTNNGSDTVSVVDLTASRLMGAWPVGVTPLSNNGPHHIAIDPAARAFFTPLAFPAPAIAPGPHALHGSSTVPGVLVKRSLDDFRLLGRVDVDANPGDVVLSPDRSRAYVSHYNLAETLARIREPRDMRLSNLVVVDARTMQRVASVPTCVMAHGMAMAPDGRTLYVTCAGDDALAVVDLTRDPPAVEVVPIGTGFPTGSPSYGPYSIAMSPDGSLLYVGCTEARALLAFDTTTRRWDPARSTRALRGSGYFPAFSADGATVIVPTQNTDTVMRLRVGAPPTVVDTVTFAPSDCRLPHQVARGPDGRLYVVCEGLHGALTSEPGTLLVLDDNLQMVGRYTMGVYSDAIGFVEQPR